MRYLCFLTSWLLLRLANGLEGSEGTREDKHATSIDSGPRLKRSCHSHGRRGLRQAGYFETSGDINLDSEFLGQDLKNSGIEEKLVSENRSQYEVGGPGVEEATGAEFLIQPSSLQLLSKDRLSDTEPVAYRKERQTKHFDSQEQSRNQEKVDINKNFINYLKWNKNKEMVSDIFPPGAQKNEAFPVNDDIADFAVYMNKTKRRRSKTKVNTGIGCNSDTRYENFVRRTPDTENCVENERNLDPYKYNIKAYSSDDNVLPSNKYSSLVDDFKSVEDCNNVYKTKKGIGDFDDDLVFSEGGVGALERKGVFDPYPHLSGLLRHCSVDEGEMEAEAQGRQESHLSGDIVREKSILLPEPLVFNSSHVVSSFVYTMIPFRSPLLNLLENDKHSKYIMIKIDPVLEPSKRINDAEPQPLGGNVEYALEQNVMKVIDKLIGSDLQWDLTSVEGIPRSKQKNRSGNDRFNRSDSRRLADPNTVVS